MTSRTIRFAVIGCGLMGREFASAAARWLHLVDLPFRPEVVAACDPDPAARSWFERNIGSVRRATDDYTELLEDPDVDAVYCAVPHDLHERLYIDVIRAGKHLLGEKPFGIDLAANQSINAAMSERPEVFVRCSSEFPFFPGAYRIWQWAREGRFGRIIEVEAGFWHSSDLNPQKPINWKRIVVRNGAYGCMGDLGLHVLHIPLRLGWRPTDVRALLANVVSERPGPGGELVPCETWDNATLACTAAAGDATFPMILSMKRIAPGHTNTWFLRVWGTDLSAEFSTRYPALLRYLPYQPGDEQAWRELQIGYASAYPTITGGIFEFGFSDAILQMWAAFCDELMHGNQMSQGLGCARPSEVAATHSVFTAALHSAERGAVVAV